MTKWTKKTLGEVTSFITKGIPPKYVEDESSDTIKVLNQKCNRNFSISYTEARLHNNTAKKVSDKKMLKKGDVLINSTGTGTAGRVAQIWNIPTPTTIDGHMILLRPTDEIDLLYYGYAVKAHQKKIENLAEGSTGQTEINRQRLQDEIIIKYPMSLKTQYKIGQLLMNLDDKIELNNKINANLEQQAQIFFRELFINNVHFDWIKGTINDVGTVVGGGTPSKAKPEYYTSSGIAWITPKDLSINKSKFITHGQNDITEIGLKNSSATIMPKGTVLFSSRAPIGYIAIAAKEVTTNQGFKSIIPKPEIGTAYIYYFLKHNLSAIENMASGSTFKEISGSVMKSVPIIIPDKSTLTKFNDFCFSLLKQQQLLEIQNQFLIALRDTLLPKLMFGKLDVSNIDI